MNLMGAGLKWVNLLLLLHNVGISCRGPESTQHPPLAINPIDSISSVIRAYPHVDSLYFIRAQWHINDKSLDSAKLDIERALQLDPNTKPQYYFLLSDICLLQYNSKKALDILSEAQKKFPLNVSCILRYAKLQLILKQHFPALVTLDQIYAIDPQNAQAHYLAGHIFLDMADTAKAFSAFQRAVAFDPELREGWIQLGDMYVHKKDSLALACYDNALKMDSNDVETYHSKALALQSLGKISDAVATYEYITRRFADYEPAHYNLALLQLDNGETDKALQNLNRCAMLNPGEAAVYYYRAKCYEKNNQKLEAMADYQKAIKLDSSWPEPQRALRKLQGGKTLRQIEH